MTRELNKECSFHHYKNILGSPHTLVPWFPAFRLGFTSTSTFTHLEPFLCPRASHGGHLDSAPVSFVLGFNTLHVRQQCAPSEASWWVRDGRSVCLQFSASLPWSPQTMDGQVSLVSPANMTFQERSRICRKKLSSALKAFHNWWLPGRSAWEVLSHGLQL